MPLYYVAFEKDQEAEQDKPCHIRDEDEERLCCSRNDLNSWCA